MILLQFVWQRERNNAQKRRSLASQREVDEGILALAVSKGASELVKIALTLGNLLKFRVGKATRLSFSNVTSGTNATARRNHCKFTNQFLFELGNDNTLRMLFSVG